jgi:hypothetical protein
MSLLGEEVVEEWLNRTGYFTIRGIKLAGNHEIDILAITPLQNGKCECRHIECQLSFKSIGYISTGNAKRLDDADLSEEVQKWIEKKFDLPHKVELRKSLYPGYWTKELVIGNVKHQEEVDRLRDKGIIIHLLKDILSEMAKGEKTIIQSATGADLFDLMSFQSGG